MSDHDPLNSEMTVENPLNARPTIAAQRKNRYGEVVGDTALQRACIHLELCVIVKH
jgi:hypothetical protein